MRAALLRRVITPALRRMTPPGARCMGANATTHPIPPPEGGPDKVNIALLQLRVTADKAANAAAAAAAVAGAAARGAALVVLPEMWNCPYSNDSFPAYAEDLTDPHDASRAPSAAAVAAAAAAGRVTLVAGSVPERDPASGALYNTALVFGPDGRELGRHRKVHLFDVDIPGKITFQESLTLAPGARVTVVDTPAGRLGVGICYDVRFPEYAALCAARGAQVLVYPGAFNMTTGPAHWELLARARAVDNQLFVALCSPARDAAGGGYVAWGHSLVAGPFAEVLAALDEREGAAHAELDLRAVGARRAAMPTARQRRGDLYALMDLTREGPGGGAAAAAR